MITQCITMTEQSAESVEEIAEAIRKTDGEKPSRSRVIRMALAELRKSFVERGLISESPKIGGSK